MRRGAFVLVLLLIVSACGTQSYEKPISAFASATENATRHIAALADELDEEELQARRKQALESPVHVSAQEKTCGVKATRCVLFLRLDGAEGEPLTTATGTMTVRALAAQLNRYAKNLQALASAGSEEEINAAYATLRDNVHALDGVRKQLEDQAPKDAPGPKLEAAGAVLPYVTSRILNAVKASYLREVTNEAHPVIDDAADSLTIKAGAAAAAERSAKRTAFTRALSAYQTSTTPTEQQLDLLISAAAEYNTMLSGNPEGVLTKMSDAHEALKLVLEGKASRGNLSQKLEELATEVERLGALVEAVRKTRRSQRPST